MQKQACTSSGPYCQMKTNIFCLCRWATMAGWTCVAWFAGKTYVRMKVGERNSRRYSEPRFRAAAGFMFGRLSDENEAPEMLDLLPAQLAFLEFWVSTSIRRWHDDCSGCMTAHTLLCIACLCRPDCCCLGKTPSPQSRQSGGP